MSDESPILSLPYLLPSQAQKHVTHNEALRILDRIVQPVVADRDRAAPPEEPAEGDRHIVASGANGEWAGRDGEIAVFEDGSWSFVVPQAGWRAHVLAERTDVLFDPAQGWRDAELGDARAATLGVNASADAVNRLAVAADATLLNNAGSGHQLKISKAAASDTASVLFQTGWSGRAEMGTTGNDDWSIKVSADGAVWTEALRIDAATGRATGAAVQGWADDTTPDRLLKVGAFGLGKADWNPVTDGNVLPYRSTIGLFQCGPGAPNTPFPFASFLTVSRAPDRMGAIAIDTVSADEPRMAVRTMRGGDGSTAWREVFHRGNIVGSVSQSVGVPTGAVVERGSNANGEYVRWADGTQMCWGKHVSNVPIDTASQSLEFRSDAQTLTLPTAFVDTDYHVILTPENNAYCTVPQRSTSGFQYFLGQPTSRPAVSRVVNWMAVGRWL